jgi:hypothetical protein
LEEVFAAELGEVLDLGAIRIRTPGVGPLAPSSWAAYAPPAVVVWVGRIGGGIVGFAVAIIVTEVIFNNASESAPLAVTAMLVVLGVFAGSRVALHFGKPS